MSPALLWFLGWVAVAAAMAVLWAVLKRTRRPDWVDVAWSLGTGALAVAFSAASSGEPSRRALLATLAALWSLRLARHLAVRLRVSGEDGRYVTLRESRAGSADAWLFGFFQAQAFLCAFFAVPVLVAAGKIGALASHDVAGTVVWIVAIAGESVADRQLARFRTGATPAGQVCRKGLWKYSRHPNYFFEWLHWWSYVLIGWQAPFDWLTLLAPAGMLFLILRVTGIPPTEAQAVASHGEAYRRYQREVSAFFPWFPRKEQP